MSNKENICKYCRENPPVKNSHIASIFLINHIKNNNSIGVMHSCSNSEKYQDGLKRPYFCKCCENKFGEQEKYFKKNVFDVIIKNIENSKSKNIDKLSDEESIKFVLITSFRYTIYLLEEVSHDKTTEIFKNLTYSAIEDISLVGKKIFIYPWIFNPIIESDCLKVGVNHFLNFATFSATRLKNNNFPNILLLILPSMIFLLTDNELEERTTRRNTHLMKGIKYDWGNANTNLPALFNEKINEKISCMEIQMKRKGKSNPEKFQNKIKTEIAKNPLFAKCSKWDEELLDWQKKNCR